MPSKPAMAFIICLTTHSFCSLSRWCDGEIESRAFASRQSLKGGKRKIFCFLISSPFKEKSCKNVSVRAAIFEAKGKLSIKEAEEPRLKDRELPMKWKKGKLFIPKEKQVKLKVLAASICGTDVHILEGKHPAREGTILGHEYVGEVIERGKAVRRFEKGDRVVVNPNIGCEKCYHCRNGMPNLCPQMTTLGIFYDGGFAEYNVAPSKQLLRAPKKMSLKQAIFFEPVSDTVHGWNVLNPQLGDSVLIYGAGPMGCYFIKLAELAGARKVIVSEPSQYRRAIAKKVGAIATKPEELESCVKSETRRGVDIAIDACGDPGVINQAIDLVRPGGKISTFGEQNMEAFAEKVSFTKVTNRELSIYGSYAAARSLDETATILKQMPLGELITHELPLDEIHKGIELMRKRKAMKIIVYPR